MCLICERIGMIKENENEYFVAELETGYVVIGDHQYFEGYTIFLCKTHVNELHLLEKNIRKLYLEEMSIVAEAVYNAFKPDKLNYELLGNGDSHLHWHIFPRRLNEPNPKWPVWVTDPAIMFSDEVRPKETQLKNLKRTLYNELVRTGAVIKISDEL